ncbi:hypothetical protein ACHAXT_001143, partial [Thalassiosira profunda]
EPRQSGGLKQGGRKMGGGRRRHDNRDDEESKLDGHPRYDFDLGEVHHTMMSSGNTKSPPQQPATAAVNSVHWDIEEDHLLSYFLGAEGVAGDTIPEAGVVGELPVSPIGAVGAQNASLEKFVDARARESSGGLSSATGTSSSGGALPLEDPPTPVPPRYDGHHHQGQPAMPLGSMPGHSAEYNAFVHPSEEKKHGSASSLHNKQSSSQGSMHKVPSRASTAESVHSSSSSLTSMAAALALGGANQVLTVQQRLQAQNQLAAIHSLNSQSPITPVNMLGSPSGYEQMMLPPPPRFPNGMMGQNQQMMMQQQQAAMLAQQSQMMMPQPVQSSHIASSSPQQQEKPHFLPQMGPTTGPAIHQQMHNPQNIGFPDPFSVASAVLSQPSPVQSMPQPAQLQQQQFNIGVNGQSIPLTAVAGENGKVTYQIDPNAAVAGANPANLRHFAKALNEVAQPDEKDVDPEIQAEKRRQRLARNRESARNSRRRKKELLSTLSGKVQRLQRQLDTEVRNKIRSMEAGLAKQGRGLVDKWMLEESKSEDPSGTEQLALALQKAGPNCNIRRAVIAHQFNFLRQALLSTHNRYSVWMMMHTPKLFTEPGKRRHETLPSSPPPTKSPKSSSSQRANSKLLGEELYAEEKKRAKGKGMVTCSADDELRLWPLCCYEINMTMDQEERIVNQGHPAARKTPDLQEKLQKMNTALDATRHLQNAVLCHAQLSSQRNQKLLLDILTPQQTAKFLEFMQKKKGRCKPLMERQLRVDSVASEEGAESTLVEVSRQLEALRLQP